MRHPARRKALLVGVACGVALLGAGLAFREDLAFRYHTWRLESALTEEAAWPSLVALAGHIEDPARAQSLVAMLGPRRPGLTFWVFMWPHILTRERLDSVVGRLRHFARSLEDRVRRDEDFLAVMAHFMRWNKAFPFRHLLKQLEESPRSDLESVKSYLLQRESGVQEGVLTISEAWLLAEAWLLGMSPLPPSVELSFPLSEADVDRLLRRWEDLKGWVRVRRDRLRFDPASGRFVETPPGQGSPEVPVPAVPLPGWTGPVPRVPSDHFPLRDS